MLRRAELAGGLDALLERHQTHREDGHGRQSQAAGRLAVVSAATRQQDRRERGAHHATSGMGHVGPHEA